MKSLGLIEVWSQKVVRTPDGESFLASIALCPPDEALGVSDGEAAGFIAGKPVLDFVSSVSDLDQESLRGRYALIGYIPRGLNSTSREEDEGTATPTTALRKLVQICSPGLPVDGFMDLCVQELGINKSSFHSTLHTLRRMGMVEQTAYNFYAPSSDAAWLVEPGNEACLVAYLHRRYAYLGEILKNLDEPATPSQLSKIGRERYGYVQASNGEVRARLGFLQDAGLVDRIDWQRFRITSAGKAFASLLSLQEDETALPEEDNGQMHPQRQGLYRAYGIAADLKKFSEDGSESKAFEAAISRAFRFLGFHTDHLGGPGQTDVLALAELAPGDGYRVIIDAKSSSGGIVAESSVNFDVLRDHRKKHKADHVVVIGPDFANRLKDWAIENEVVLLQAADLIEIVTRHEATPIPLPDLRDTFTRVDACKEAASERHQSLDRRSSLLAKILELAYQEAQDVDPIAAGYVSTENIMYALRKEVAPRPSVDEVKEALDFLSSTFVGALEEGKGRYKLADSPHNISLRLHGLGEALKPDNIRRN